MPKGSEPSERKRSCSIANLDYDSLPPVQGVVEETQYVEYPCLTNSLLDSNVPLEFRLDKTNAATDLSQMYLDFNVKVLKADGSNLTNDDVISTVNNFGYSLFSGMDLYLQDQKISNSQGYYPYAAYLKLLLFTTENEKKYYLRQALWRRDQPGFMDRIGVDKAGVGNSGFVERSAYIASSTDCRLLIKLIFDFTIDNLIPDQTEIFLRIHRSKASTCLLAKSGDYKIKISNARLYAPRYKLTAMGNQIITTRLTRDTLRFPSTRYQVCTKMVGKNDQNCDWTPIAGALPHRIYIFQILNSAYNGSIDKNIFNFQTFNLKKLQVHKNGRCLPMSQGVDVKADSPTLLYTMSLQAINRPDCISFTEWEYANGYMIACFDLSSDGSGGTSSYRSGPETGTIRVQLDYAKPLTEAITVFCVSEEFGLMQMDRQRNPHWLY
jgi:hypothetical protein